MAENENFGVDPLASHAAPAPGYHIIDRRTGGVVGQAKTLKGARRSVDKRDNTYGAYIHHIRRIDSGEKVF